MRKRRIHLDPQPEYSFAMKASGAVRVEQDFAFALGICQTAGLSGRTGVRVFDKFFVIYWVRFNARSHR
jgi:hypothetical protein